MSSSAAKQPSIFTSRESFYARSADTSLHDHTRPPLRRQSTPDYFDKSRVQEFATKANVGGQGTPPGHKKPLATPPTWPSYASGEKHSGSLAEPSLASKGRSASTGHTSTTTPPTEFPPELADTAVRDFSKKRRPVGSPYSERGPTSEPLPHKRQRVGGKPRPRHFLDNFPVAAGNIQPDLQPPSPLFFSNSPRTRPTLPPRFSSSEAAAKMLSNARSEDKHIKTVSLPRGHVSTPFISAGAPHFYSSSRGSSERHASILSQSPDPSTAGARELNSLLNSIGIVELLEQDERPTFIVDLGDKDNYGPGSLHLLFSNSSLRNYTGLEALISGVQAEDASPGFLQFKSWLMSSAVDGESLNVSLPSFLYANMSWNCSTLRKRLRIVSGAFFATPGSGRPPVVRSSMPPSTSAEVPSLESVLATEPSSHEQSDYFGNAAPSAEHIAGTQTGKLRTDSETPIGIPAKVVPTIEQEFTSSSSDTVTQDPPLMDVEELLATPDIDLSGATDLLPPASTYLRSPPGLSSALAGPAQWTSSHIGLVPSDAPSFDWTRLPISDILPRHIQFARSVDWAATSLGPIEAWNSDLRQMCNLIMASPHPAAMYWGEDMIAIYNEAYIPLAGQKHPKLMGQSYQVAWAEIWDEVKDVFASARTTGEATMKDDDCLFLKRGQYLEETFFSWSIIPCIGRDGSVMGLYNPAFEKTRRKIAERRMLTLREVGERTASARDVKQFWSQVLGSFEYNESDSPFLMMYSVSDEADSDSSSIHSNSVFATRQCLLEGSLGVPNGHPAAPDQIDLKEGIEGFGPAFREVMKTDKPIVLEVGSRELPETLIQGLQWRGFGDPVRAVVVCPIHPTTGETVLGFLVVGVNPRRPYDDDYALFIQLLSRQLATSLASVVLFEEEIRRGQKAAKLAALDRIELSEQLAARTQEAIDSETKFTRMAEFAPVGMFIAGSDGKITFANDTWYDISRVPKNSNMADTWMHAVMPDDYALVKRLWEDLTVKKKLVNSEFRFKARWEDRSGHSGDTWVLFSGYPEKYDDGRLKSVFGSITDISQQKWAEGIQTRKMEEAVELKRQQENFIDITSHEMRNPLSAILQCADEISMTLTNFRQSGNKDLADGVISSCFDAAQIISLCSQHQKRIVDDILTLSKLDSQLLLVTPVDAQPLTVVQRALRMHEGELQAADIQLKFVVDQSYRKMSLDWLRFDPSRVLQVLINLTTNAIKFTSTESRRTISVTISASKDRPSNRPDAPVKYFPTRRPGNAALMDDREWGEGEKVYVHFSVRDTGRGLNPEEKKMLFMRFSQASPRTHVQYGGSGLGLFISRELTELQGGEIGVESESGKGSVFAFYVVARRSSAPANTDAATGLKRASQSESSLKVASPTATKTPAPLSSAVGSTANGAATAPKSPLQKRVLIVEDNLVNQRVLQKQLKNAGTEVHLANHGGEALDKLRQSTYWIDKESPVPADNKINIGVVLMDQEMPVMDGLTCTKKIRELEKAGKLSGHIPIIAVTANARAEQIQTALDVGMDDVVSKPFRIPELVPKIEELMQRYPAPEA